MRKESNACRIARRKCGIIARPALPADRSPASRDHQPRRRRTVKIAYSCSSLARRNWQSSHRIVDKGGEKHSLRHRRRQSKLTREAVNYKSCWRHRRPSSALHNDISSPSARCASDNQNIIHIIASPFGRSSRA